MGEKKMKGYLKLLLENLIKVGVCLTIVAILGEIVACSSITNPTGRSSIPYDATAQRF